MTNEEQIIQLFEDGDRALISGNVAELQRIYAEDYVQYDEQGTASNRKEMIARLTSGRVRFIAMVSTGRSVRFLNEDVAIVHGSEEDEVAREGTAFHARYVYTDVVIKRDGRWQIVASQLVKQN